MAMLLEKLKAAEGFTHQEKAVAQYILDKIELIQNMSSDELAKASYTSKATVGRLCKKVGMSGYKELKFQLVSEMVENARINQLLSQEPITEKSGYRDILNTLPKLYDKAITVTQLCMDKNVMIRIFNRIKAADRIFIYGTGISYNVAEAAAFKFATLGIECYACDSINSHYLAATKTEKAVSFLITLTGANRSMIDVAHYLKEATDAYVVGIVGRHHKDISQWCNEIVEIPSRGSILSLRVITSFMASIYVLDIFFSMYLSLHYHEHVSSSLSMLSYESLRTAEDCWDLDEPEEDGE